MLITEIKCTDCGHMIKDDCHTLTRKRKLCAVGAHDFAVTNQQHDSLSKSGD